jgi:hypothetical protein
MEMKTNPLQKNVTEGMPMIVDSKATRKNTTEGMPMILGSTSTSKNLVAGTGTLACSEPFSDDDDTPEPEPSRARHEVPGKINDDATVSMHVTTPLPSNGPQLPTAPTSGGVYTWQELSRNHHETDRKLSVEALAKLYMYRAQNYKRGKDNGRKLRIKGAREIAAKYLREVDLYVPLDYEDTTSMVHNSDAGRGLTAHVLASRYARRIRQKRQKHARNGLPKPKLLSDDEYFKLAKSFLEKASRP